jgi:hypothetical protein
VPTIENGQHLAQDLDFIKAGCHLGKYVMATVNLDMDSTFLHINVISYAIPLLTFLVSNQPTIAENCRAFLVEGQSSESLLKEYL